MKDAILKHIELNETYHEAKERLAWLATVFYVSFSVASIVSFSVASIEQFLKICNFEPGLTLLFLVTVYLAGLGYASFQFRHRWNSTCITYALRRMLKDYQKEDPVSLFTDKFEEAVKKTHGGNKYEQEYKAVIEFIKQIAEIRKVK